MSTVDKTGQIMGTETSDRKITVVCVTKEEFYRI